MEMDRKKAIIIAIILLTMTTLAVGASNGWFRFIYDPTGVIVDDTYMEDDLELKGLPLWFSADVSISGSGFSGQEHTVSLSIFHDRPSNGAPWFADGNYSLDLKLAGIIVENITSGPFTDLSTSNPYTIPYQWTPSSPPDNYTIALNITDVKWREVPTYTITATAGLGGTINSNGEIASYGAPVDFFVLPGGSLYFDIYPDPDYVIENVLVDGSSVGTENYYDFTDVQADSTIEALFVYNPAPTVVSVTAVPDPATAGTVTVTVVFSEAMDTSISPTVTVMGLQSSTYIVSESTYAGDTWVGTFNLNDDNEVATASVHVVGGTDSTGVMMIAASPAGTFEVDTTHIEYTITVTPGSGGIIEPIGPVTVIEGDNQTFMITPNAGNVILDVVINGASKGAISEYTFTDVQADQTITAEFQQGYTYSSTRMIVEGANIILTTASFDGSDPKTYRLGETVSFVIDAVWDQDGTTGFNLSSLTYDVKINRDAFDYTVITGVTLPFDPVIITPGGTFQFTGSFIQDVADGAGNWNLKIVVTDAGSSEYTITATAGTGGSIAPSGATTVTHGQSQEYTITPEPGYAILDVLVDGITNLGPVSSHLFESVTEDHTIHATFFENTEPTVVSATADPDPATAGIVTVTVVFNEMMDTAVSPTVTVTGLFSSPYAVSESTYSSDTWVGTFTLNDDNEEATATISVSGGKDTTGNTMIEDLTAGTFEVVRVQHIITASAGLGGSISPDGANIVLEGDSLNFIIRTPNSGYAIEDVVVDGSSVGSVSSYLFEDVTEDHTIHATFFETTRFTSPFQTSAFCFTYVNVLLDGSSLPAVYKPGDPVSMVYTILYEEPGYVVSSITYKVSAYLGTVETVLVAVKTTSDMNLQSGSTFDIVESFTAPPAGGYILKIEILSYTSP